MTEKYSFSEEQMNGIVEDTYKNIILECKKLIDKTNCPNEQILALLSLVASNFSRNLSDKKNKWNHTYEFEEIKKSGLLIRT